MPPSVDRHDVPAPERPIRRFDVFAEYSRQERREKGFAPDEAKGYGIWLAKVVASRRFGGGAPSERSQGHRDHPDSVKSTEPKFRSLGDELQTDETFDEEIVDRMGPRFYEQVFVPAVTEARAHGKSYESIRDAIRTDWKTARSRSR